MNIQELIGETTEYDKKLAVEKRKVKSWLKSVSAFSNTVGGLFIFGISNDDEIIGLDHVKEDSEFISQKIKERIDPIPKINMHIILPNLNYGIDTNEPNCDTNHDTNYDTNHDTNCDTNQNDYLSKRELQILKMIKLDGKVSQKQLVIKTGLSIASVKRITKRLSDCNYIERIGGTRGYWKVLKEMNK